MVSPCLMYAVCNRDHVPNEEVSGIYYLSPATISTVLRPARRTPEEDARHQSKPIERARFPVIA